MSQYSSEAKLLFPGLQPFYERVAPFSWLIIRLTVGLILAAHGTLQIGRLEAYLQTGVAPSDGLVRTSILFVTEFVGGICIAAGLFTRFFAAAAAIEMAYITFFVFWKNGFFFMTRGYEYELMWGIILFAIALRGAGYYSLDRLIGRQL